MQVRKGYRFRLYPTLAQQGRLAQWSGALRWLWNLAHEQRLLGLAASRKRFYTAFDQINQLTELRAEVPWLADVPRDVCAELLVDLDKAWQRCFRKLAKKPRFKRRGRDCMAPCEPHPKAWRIDGDRVFFPKLGPLKAVIHRAIEGKGKTCRLVNDAGQWFACIAVEAEVAEPVQPTGEPVGIDRGVINLLADSNERLVAAPRRLDRYRRSLTRAQRRVCRKQKGSKNRERAKQRVAVLHRTVRRQRDHVLHVESLHYAKSHGTVVVERLQTRNMTASARGSIEEPGRNVRQKAGLNRSILDAGWRRFENMLGYKCGWHGSILEEVNPAYTSQTCSCCGHVDALSRLSQAVFQCVSCGHRENADTNAAKVILSRRSVGGAGCGGQGAVRPPKRQQLRVARRGQRSMSVGAQGVPSMPKAPASRPG